VYLVDRIVETPDPCRRKEARPAGVPEAVVSVAAGHDLSTPSVIRGEDAVIPGEVNPWLGDQCCQPCDEIYSGWPPAPASGLRAD